MEVAVYVISWFSSDAFSIYSYLMFAIVNIMYLGVFLFGLILFGALCDPMDCSSPASSVRGISQARILE